MRKGFTLVELVVVIGIAAMISAVALANFPNFRDRIALNKESGKVAAALRSAQSLSLGVRQFNPSPGRQGNCSETFQSNFPSYGASFATGDRSYYLFGDINCNTRLDADIEKVKEFLFDGGIQIKKICVDVYDSNFDCSGPSAPNTTDAVDIVYARPFPQIKISSAQCASGSACHASAMLELHSRDGITKRSVVILSSGQISIENKD